MDNFTNDIQNYEDESEFLWHIRNLRRQNVIKLEQLQQLYYLDQNRVEMLKKETEQSLRSLKYMDLAQSNVNQLMRNILIIILF